MTSEPKKINVSITNIIAVASSIGMICWFVTDFLGGMVLWAISYISIIISILFLYVFSFIETLISLIKKRKKTSNIKLIAYGIVLLSMVTLNLYKSEIFKSEIVMKAILKDDFYHYILVFRKDNSVENQINGFMGYSKTIHGKYKIEDNLIIFQPKPYTNNFIPDTILIDRKQNALFIEKDKNGNFRTQKEWLNHFKIEKIQNDFCCMLTSKEIEKQKNTKN